MPIRVISGSAKGRKLRMVPGNSTRPIMDRVKEALFNILGTGVVGSSFLDLFAGTGSVGIEALSRGAARALFIDNDRMAIRTVQENLTHTRLLDRAELLRLDVFTYLQRPNPEAFEYIYIAPPQYKRMWHRVLLALDSQAQHLVPDGIAVVQIDPSEKIDLDLVNLSAYDERYYGNTMLWFFERVIVPDEDDNSEVPDPPREAGQEDTP